MIEKQFPKEPTDVFSRGAKDNSVGSLFVCAKCCDLKEIVEIIFPKNVMNPINIITVECACSAKNSEEKS